MRKPLINAFKKELPPKQREELLLALKVRFEKNKNRHMGIEWAKVQAKLEANAGKLWPLNEMERPAVNRMLLVMIKRPTNIFFMIVRRKALKAAEVFATTATRWNRGKSINQKIVLSVWLLNWVLNFYRKSNIESCRNLEISIRKHQAG